MLHVKLVLRCPAVPRGVLACTPQDHSEDYRSGHASGSKPWFDFSHTAILLALRWGVYLLRGRRCMAKGCFQVRAGGILDFKITA